MILLNMQRELPWDFETRLVEAGESPAGIDRFELRVDVPIAAFFELKKAASAFLAQFAAVSLDLPAGAAEENTKPAKSSPPF